MLSGIYIFSAATATMSAFEANTSSNVRTVPPPHHDVNLDLLVASKSGHAGTVSLLIQNGAWVNVLFDTSPLMEASSEGHSETVPLLLLNASLAYLDPLPA